MDISPMIWRTNIRKEFHSNQLTCAMKSITHRKLSNTVKRERYWVTLKNLTVPWTRKTFWINSQLKKSRPTVRLSQSEKNLRRGSRRHRRLTWPSWMPTSQSYPRPMYLKEPHQWWNCVLGRMEAILCWTCCRLTQYLPCTSTWDHIWRGRSLSCVRTFQRRCTRKVWVGV